MLYVMGAVSVVHLHILQALLTYIQLIHALTILIRVRGKVPTINLVGAKLDLLDILDLCCFLVFPLKLLYSRVHKVLLGEVG